MKFYGLADAHGLESFMPLPYVDELVGFQPDPKIVSGMALRSEANIARHSVVYIADVTLEAAKEITALLEAGEEAEALIYLKENHKQIQIRKRPGSQKSWRLIPNPDLDANRN
jgi:hypothetical protein